MFTALIHSKKELHQQRKTLIERLSGGRAKAWLAPTERSRKAASIFALMKLMTPPPPPPHTHTHTHTDTPPTPQKWHIYHPGDLCTPRLQGSSSIWRGQICLQIYPPNLSPALHLLTVFSIKVDAVLLNLRWHRNVRKGGVRLLGTSTAFSRVSRCWRSLTGDSWNCFLSFMISQNNKKKSCRFVWTILTQTRPEPACGQNRLTPHAPLCT